MNPVRIAYILCSTATAACALIAARYWYASSRPTPESGDPPKASVSDVPELHIMNAQVGLYRVQAALAEASRLNKKAAAWSAVAALFGTAAAMMGIA